jgi:hypothetical protein
LQGSALVEVRREFRKLCADPVTSAVQPRLSRRQRYPEQRGGVGYGTVLVRDQDKQRHVTRGQAAKGLPQPGIHTHVTAGQRLVRSV